MNITSLLAFSIILSFGGSPLPQMHSLDAKDAWATANLSAQETQQIITAAEQVAFDTPDSWEKELRVRRVDLGGGTPGIVAQGTSLLCGGTGNCQIFVFRKVDGRWTSLFKTNAPIADGFQLGPTPTLGIADLTITANSSAAASKRTVYKFDGQFYQEADGNTDAVSPEKTAAAPTRTDPLFEFHSNFWVNLHQVLLHEALLRGGKPDRRLQSSTPLVAEQMTESEKSSWNTAIDFYGVEFQSRQELFDDELVRINDRLAQEPDDGATLDTAQLPPRIAEVLQSVAPVYQKYWWQAHNKSNEDWISSQAQRVKELAPRVAMAMEADLHHAWPAAPLRVDVCYYVPQIGHAYTTDGPPHTTFSSSAPTLQDTNGFETLFHEASHSFADTMTDALFKECGAQKKNCGDLWHAVLFYTAGVETRRALSPADQANFTPYAYRYGLYSRGEYPKYRIVLETDWQAYLDGKKDFAAAIHAMVADLQ